MTLRGDGQVMFYDTIHNCGCYHLVFPSPNVRVVKRQSGHEEPLFVAPFDVVVDGRAVIRVQSATHYVQRVYFEAGLEDQEIPYALRAYDELRSLLVSAAERRSLFDSDGLVPGTQRGERWLFWPMGVREPGAMRQWGTHAIAFVGRRHFDDADLFAPYLEFVP